jgi:hypothetical protein
MPSCRRTGPRARRCLRDPRSCDRAGRDRRFGRFDLQAGRHGNDLTLRLCPASSRGSFEDRRSGLGRCRLQRQDGDRVDATREIPHPSRLRESVRRNQVRRGLVRDRSHGRLAPRARSASSGPGCVRRLRGVPMRCYGYRLPVFRIVSIPARTAGITRGSILN